MSAGSRLPGTPEPMHRWQLPCGITIAGDSWGGGDGPLVILLHGGGQTRHAWKGVGERLGSAGFHAVAFDARGHGDSDWSPEGVYTQEAMVEDLRCVISALGKGRPALVGASMGGGTSLAAIGSGRVDAAALVLVDIAPRVEEAGVDNIETFMNQSPDGFVSLQAVAEAISNYQPHRPRPRNLDGLAKNVRMSPDGTYRWHWDPRFFPSRIDLVERHRVLAACALNLTLPVLLVRGEMSDVLSEEGVREFLDLCPHAEFVSIADAAHMVAGDRNDVFGSTVIEFLEAVAFDVGGVVVKPATADSGPSEGLMDVP